MNLFKSLATTLVVGAMSTASVFAFECTGNSECIFEVNGNTPQSCIEAIEIITGPLTGSGPVQLSIVDYKSLAGTCFTLASNREGVNLITQTQTPAGYSFVYSSTYAQAEVPGIPGTFTAQNELRLESVNLYPNPLGQNPGQIAYRVTEDVHFVNGSNELTVFEGSSVIVETKKPVIVCELFSNRCYITIDGTDYEIAPEITIESENPESAGPGIRIGHVLAKQLMTDLGLEMVIDFDRPADESFFALEEVNPGDEFPVNVEGNFATQIEFEGETFRSDQVLQVKSTNPVENWPAEAGSVEYVITEPVQYISDSGREIVIHEGVISN